MGAEHLRGQVALQQPRLFGHLVLRLENQLLVVVVAAARRMRGAQAAVDGPDDAEGNPVLAVGHEAVEVFEEQGRELPEGGQSLPAEAVEAEALDPLVQEADGGPR
jgi:hypothetical protein